MGSEALAQGRPPQAERVGWLERMAHTATGGGRIPTLRILIVLGIAVAGPLSPPGTRTVLLVLLVYAIFAMAYDLLLGYSDQPSLGQGLFFGVGAYAIALPILDWGAGLGTALVIAVLVGATVAALLGTVAVRLTAAFHVIVTALFASIAYLVANTLTPVTGGSGGRTVRLPSISLGVAELSVYDPLGTYALVAGMTIFVYVLLERLLSSPVGRMWMTIRENPLRAASIGVHVFRFKLAAFVIAGTITTVAGALYAVTLRFASAEFFAFIWSVFPFIWVLIGGTGTLTGALVGAAIFALFQFYVAQLWTHYLLVFGVAMLVLLRWNPRGLVGVFRGQWPHLSAEDLRDKATRR